MNKLFITQKAKYQNDNDFRVFNDYIEDTDLKTLADLYKRLKQNCKGKLTKMYVDDAKGQAVHVGYVLTFKNKDDDGDSYVEQQWIELLVAKVVTRPRTEYLNMAQARGE